MITTPWKIESVLDESMTPSSHCLHLIRIILIITHDAMIGVNRANEDYCSFLTFVMMVYEKMLSVPKKRNKKADVEKLGVVPIFQMQIAL